MTVEVVVSGFGRIGRRVTRIIAERDDLEFVTINDTTEFELTKCLLGHDMVCGELDASVEFGNDNLLINNRKVKMFHTRNINESDFVKHGVQLVFECTSAYST